MYWHYALILKPETRCYKQTNAFNRKKLTCFRGTCRFHCLEFHIQWCSWNRPGGIRLAASNEKSVLIQRKHKTIEQQETAKELLALTEKVNQKNRMLRFPGKGYKIRLESTKNAALSWFSTSLRLIVAFKCSCSKVVVNTKLNKIVLCFDFKKITATFCSVDSWWDSFRRFHFICYLPFYLLVYPSWFNEKFKTKL